MPDRSPKRRREDSSGRRPAYERALLQILGGAALVGLAAGVWWLWAQSAVGAVIRDGSPNWAPDGRVIFSSERGGKADLFLADRSGGDRQQLTITPGDEGGATYSLDGREIAFHSDGDGNYEIYVRAANSEITRRLTTHPATDEAPTWSRDGTHIVFVSDRDNPEFDLYRMNAADGSGLERLTYGGSHRFPQYSPDGSQVALHMGRDIYVMSLATKAARRLTTEPQNGMYPSWSPDGSRLAFMSWRNGRSQIFLMQSDGSDAKPVVTMPTGDAISPRWSPDGKFIAFVHVPEGGVASPQEHDQQRIVYVLELATGKVSRVSK